MKRYTEQGYLQYSVFEMCILKYSWSRVPHIRSTHVDIRSPYLHLDIRMIASQLIREFFV